MRRLAVVLLIGVALVTTGCLDVEESITLNRNISGQAGLTMQIDGEPLVPLMAAMQRRMAGKSGAPTAADLAAARAQMLKDANPQEDFDKDRRDLEQHLPAGVKLLKATLQHDGLKSTADILFSFANAASLKQILLSGSDQSESDGPGNPVSQPFDGLQIVDDGQTILLTSHVLDPATSAKSQAQQMPMDPAMQQMLGTMLSGMRVAVRITAPFAIVEQNATRKEGNTLVWEFDGAHLQAMTPAQLSQGIRVRYRK